jgi:predicted dehydrogenase
VAEPVKYKRENAMRIHNIDPKNAVTTWEHLFDRPKFADAILVSTPDHLHYGPAMAALNAGYDMILEKPISQTWNQCADILALAQKKKAIVGVCHVLRYAPYFAQMREVIRSGMIGDVVSIQHLEPIHYLHFAHSYVRGIWRNEKQSNPSLLAKSCHDLDIIRWMVGASCERVSSFGSRKYFDEKYAPQGAPKHCMDGCPIEDTCIYHAAQVYVHKKLWGWGHIETDNRTPEGILAALRTGQYGKCVYRNDNTVVDHQIVNMQFAGNVTAAFSMEAMTSYAGRRTRIMGTKGDLVGDENILDIYDFENRKAIRWDASKAFGNLDGHGGGDIRLCKDFCHAVDRRDESLLKSNLAESMESHLIGFQAEKSRNSGGQVQTVKMPRNS